jgi:hypothetical protein
MSNTTALDLIKGALRRITAYQPGESIAPLDAQDCLDTLNDLFDSWSTDKMMVFGSNENILQWVAGQSQYKIGNPTQASLGEPPILGTLTASIPMITTAKVPSDLVVGATLSDAQNLIPLNTTVLAVNTGSIMMSSIPTGASQGLDQITYTIPGDFAIPRPLRITNGFTRINSLDFTFNVMDTQDRFLEILYKAQPGPWPTVGWYNNLMPYGVLNVYQTPGQNAEVHLFTDTILSNLTLNQTFVLPQGYTRAIKWCLAQEICAEFGYPLTPTITKNADQSLSFLKALNAQPAATARYDRALVRGNRPDGGWIISGGYK